MDNLTLVDALKIIKALHDGKYDANAPVELKNRVTDAVELLEEGEFVDLYYTYDKKANNFFWSEFKSIDGSQFTDVWHDRVLKPCAGTVKSIINGSVGE